MRGIILHRRAARYLRRMPKDRQIQMRDALRAVAGLPEITGHPGVKPLGGDLSGWCRLRVGVYRAFSRPAEPGRPKYCSSTTLVRAATSTEPAKKPLPLAAESRHPLVDRWSTRIQFRGKPRAV